MARKNKETQSHSAVLMAIIFFFLGVIVEWLIVAAEIGIKMENFCRTCDEKIPGISGWTLLIFFIVFLVAIIIWLIADNYEYEED